MKQAFILVGIQGSGKTTYVKKLMREMDSTNFHHLNRDSFRIRVIEDEYNSIGMFDDGKKNLWDYFHFDKHEDKANEMYQEACEKAFKIDSGVVVVDNMNLSPKKVNGISTNLKNRGFDVHVKYFDVDLNTALHRNEIRQHKLPLNAINDSYITFYTNYSSKINNISLSDRKRCIIFDVDGTLAHNNHNRSPYDTGKTILKDDVDDIVSELVRFYYNGCNVSKGNERKRVIILSGRKSDSYDYTAKWLNINNIPYDCLFMRRRWDNRKDCDIKKEIYANCINPFYVVDAVFDDRPQVVNMWNDIGLKTFACSDQRIEF